MRLMEALTSTAKSRTAAELYFWTRCPLARPNLRIHGRVLAADRDIDVISTIANANLLS